MLSKDGIKQRIFLRSTVLEILKSLGDISLINVRGRRSVIISPELTFNSGWEFIAEKVGRFLLPRRWRRTLIKQRLVDNNISHAEGSSKWISRSDSEVNVQPALMVEGPILIDDNTSTISEVLKGG